MAQGLATKTAISRGNTRLRLPSTFIAALDVEGQVPTFEEMQTALKSAYSASSLPTIGDTVGLTIDGVLRYRATIAAKSAGDNDIYDVNFYVVEGAGYPTYYAHITEIGAVPAANPFAATGGKNEDGDLVITGVAGGLLLTPLVMAPALTVAAITADVEAGMTHAWLKVEWSTAYALTSAVIELGTAWPPPVSSAGDRYINIAIAYVDSGALISIATGNITLHIVFGVDGVLLLPASS